MAEWRFSQVPRLFLAGLGLLGCFLIYVQPHIFLAFFTYLLLSCFIGHILLEEGVIDLGQPIGRPIARFDLGRHEFRIHPLLTGVAVNEPRVEIAASAALLGLSFCLFTLTLWLDGWPALDRANHSGGDLPNTAPSVELPRPKVLKVDDGSVAVSAGLSYGDVITQVNGVAEPELMATVGLLRKAARAELRVERFGRIRSVVLDRGGAQLGRLYGVTLVPSLAIDKHVIVDAVRVGGKAYRSGIRPTHVIQVSPEPPYLSELLLQVGWKEGLYRSLTVRGAPTDLRPWRRSAADEEIRVSATEIDDEWVASLVPRSFYARYEPTALEALQFSVSSLAWALLPNGFKGSRAEVGTFIAIHTESSTSARTLWRQMLYISIRLGLFLLISGVVWRVTRNEWFGVIAAAVWALSYVWSGLLKLAVADSGMDWVARSLPLGDILVGWKV